jgi:hypothetical protein
MMLVLESRQDSWVAVAPFEAGDLESLPGPGYVADDGLMLTDKEVAHDADGEYRVRLTWRAIATIPYPTP